VYKFLKSIFVAGLCIILVGCSNSRSFSLTEEEINGFIADNNINNIAVEMIDDMAVVLFSEKSAVGFHILYKDRNGSIQDQSVFGITSNDVPVFISGSSTMHPFVTVIINDDEMLKSASSVEVTFSDGSKISKKFSGKGIIIPYENKGIGNMFYFYVVIYDKEDNVIYHSGMAD